MARRIREKTLQAAGATVPGGEADGYTDKIVKYVPADVIAAWTAAIAVIKGASTLSPWLILVCLLVGLAVTYWWTLRQTATEHQPPAYWQAFIAAIAFLVWVLALGDLNDVLPAWHPEYGKLILIGFTLISGKV